METLGRLFLESITEPLRVFCTILTFIIPYAIYKINLLLHESGDPPWQKEQSNQKDNSTNSNSQSNKNMNTKQSK